MLEVSRRTVVKGVGQEIELPAYKREFIANAIDIGALTLNEEKKLKSDRMSPFFFNMGGYSKGSAVQVLAKAYAHAIKEKFGDKIDENTILYGVPEKGVAFVGAVAAELSGLGINIDYCFTRKIPKGYGDATGKATMFVGREPRAGDKIILLDDVLTTGETKEEAVALFRGISKEIQIIGLVIALDRQEMGIHGGSAVEAFVKSTGVQTESIVNAADINQYLAEEMQKPESERNKRVTESVLFNFQKYMLTYGTDHVVRSIGVTPQKRLFEAVRTGVIPACDDMTIEQFEELVKKTKDVDGVLAFKVGIDLTEQGLARAARILSDNGAVGILDIQKWPTDIADRVLKEMTRRKSMGFSSLIAFPESGPEVQRVLIYGALQDQGVTIIGGGWMTHKGYVAPDALDMLSKQLESERPKSPDGKMEIEQILRMIGNLGEFSGGFTEKYLLRTYRNWVRMGVTNFVIPATNPDACAKIVKAIEEEYAKFGYPDIVLTFMSPGIGAQGGDVAALVKAVGPRHTVVGIEGRAILMKSPTDKVVDVTESAERAKVAVAKIRKALPPTSVTARVEPIAA